MKFLFNNKDTIQDIDDKKCIFVDGTSTLIDYDKDLELSHWIPNQTPKQYKADTSTQVCFNFIKDDKSNNYDLVINNHVDADGILSAYVILYPEISLKYESIIAKATLMGDFSAYGDYDVAHFYIHLVEWIKNSRELKFNNQAIFEKCFEHINKYFHNEYFPFDTLVKDSYASLNESSDLLDSKQIIRTLIHDTFTTFYIPYSVSIKSNKQAIYKAGFDFGLDTRQLLPMQLLNQHDFERQKLIIVETIDNQYYYDLLLPDYLWAETSTLYRPKGVQSTDSTNIHIFNRPDLTKLCNDLNQLEKNEGRWVLADTFHPFASIKGRGFPVVLSFMLDDQVTPSSIHPSEITQSLAKVL
ncbi:MAG: hypothetical protein KC646_08620 [Candidatus Cloacimonetes bacterium]|nr:hypothetical protein [Candidatus Cloacimonadota bacterium]